jgi:hypothetical protein
MVEFGELLGYEYGGAEDASYGKRMHVEGMQYSKKKLAPLYASADFEPGNAKDLKLHYNIVLRIFWENIVPSLGKCG